MHQKSKAMGSMFALCFVCGKNLLFYVLTILIISCRLEMPAWN